MIEVISRLKLKLFEAVCTVWPMKIAHAHMHMQIKVWEQDYSIPLCMTSQDNQ